MRHGDKVNNLGRKVGHRQALLKNLAISLIEHKRIFTTLAKAKALRTFIEPIITKSKSDSQHNRRVVYSYLQNKDAIGELFNEIANKVGERNGGYTRIIKTGNRQGDAAEMAMIELVDFNEVYVGGKSGDAKKAKTTRRGRSKKVAGKKDETSNEEESNTEASTEVTE